MTVEQAIEKPAARCLVDATRFESLTLFTFQNNALHPPNTRPNARGPPRGLRPHNYVATISRPAVPTPGPAMREPAQSRAVWSSQHANPGVVCQSIDDKDRLPSLNGRSVWTPICGVLRTVFSNASVAIPTSSSVCAAASSAQT